MPGPPVPDTRKAPVSDQRDLPGPESHHPSRPDVPLQDHLPLPVEDALTSFAAVRTSAAGGRASVGGLRGFAMFLRDNAHWLAAGVLLAFASCFGQTFVIAVRANSIMTEFGIGHAAWGTIFMIATLASAVAMVWAGALIDRFRVRTIGAFTMAGLALACAAMAVNPFVWALPVVMVALRFFGVGMATHISAVAMTRWFVASRGRAVAVSLLGYALGEAVLPLSFVVLADRFGWRFAWGLAAAVLVALIPVLIRLLRTERTPQSIAFETPVAGLGARHWQRRDVLRAPLFWLLVPGVILPWACVTSLFFHQVHLAESRGWSHVALVALFPAYTASWIAAMAVAGWAVDRFGAWRLMAWYPLTYAAGFAVIWQTASLGGAVAGLMLVGLGAGAHGTIPTVFWAEAFGTRHLGAIKAMVAGMMVFGSASGPWITGLLIDRGHDFGGQAIFIAVLFVLCSLSIGVAMRQVRQMIGADHAI